MVSKIVWIGWGTALRFMFVDAREQFWSTLPGGIPSQIEAVLGHIIDDDDPDRDRKEAVLAAALEKWDDDYSICNETGDRL